MESDNRFNNLLRQLDLSSDSSVRQKLVDNFIEAIKNDYPVYESETDVVLLYKGNADRVVIIGDMTEWARTAELNKIDGTDLHYIHFKLEPDACLEYWYLVDDNQNPVVDPLNPNIIYNGLGDISELAMPGYSRHSYFDNFCRGQRGGYDSLIELEVPPGKLPYTHQVHVYLPPDYNGSGKNYPAIYFQDGRDYIEFAVVPYLLNRMIDEGKIKPGIAVFVTPTNLHLPEVPNRMTEYGLNDDYAHFFVNELTNFIERQFRIVRESGSRLVIGDSYGGLISTYIGFKHPEIFGNVYSQSGYHCFQKDRMIRLFKEGLRRQVKLFIDCGTYEHEVGSTFLPEGERDFINANRRLREALSEKKYDFVYREYHEGHTWGNWRRHLIDALVYFWGKK